MKYVAGNKPRTFILENVLGLMFINGGRYFKAILDVLNDLEYYNIYHELLDTSQHSLPQSRRRVYIVGIAKDCLAD